jgi:imidazolonepropionase-like amidohydrolase
MSSWTTRRGRWWMGALLALAVAPLAFAGTGPIVIRAGHIETLAGDPIEGGAILVVDGRIAQIGAEVEVPTGAEVIDLPNARVFPGLVDPFSQVGLQDVGGGPGGNAHLGTADAIYPYQEAYEHVARAGYTTLCLASRAPGMAGQAALVRVRADSAEEMLLSDRGPLVANYSTTAPAADIIAGQLSGGGDDGRLASVKLALRGEIPLIVTCRNAGDVLRVLKLLEPCKDAKPVLVCSGSDTYLVASELGKRKASVVVPAAITYRRFTRIRINLPRMLTEAGAKVACLPGSDTPTSMVSVRTVMADLVRSGLDRQAALKALTAYPAEMLGLDYRLGTLAVGRDANLIILDGDLLDPTAKVLRVLLEGKTVYDAAWGGLR